MPMYPNVYTYLGCIAAARFFGGSVLTRDSLLVI
jgi:hypothetical protein